MPVVGLADETSARRWLCGVSLVRSSRQQPFTTERPGGDDQPQGGVALSTHLEAENNNGCEAWRLSTVERKRTMIRGVKFIWAQHYAGVDTGCRQIAMESTGVYWKPIFH